MEEKCRLDRWLWGVRLYKTRSLAAKAVTLGQVEVEGQTTKASRALRIGELVTVRKREQPTKTVKVLAQVPTRVSAAQAAHCYAETEASLAEAARWDAARRAQAQLPRTAGAPDTRTRRALRRLKQGSEP